MNIGERILERRTQIKMSQETFAKRTNVTVEIVETWETGSVIPETLRLSGIAHALNTSVEYLLEEDDYWSQ